MVIKIEFNPRLDKEQIKKTIKDDKIEERIIDAINRNEGGLRVINWKDDEVYTILIEEE